MKIPIINKSICLASYLILLFYICVANVFAQSVKNTKEQNSKLENNIEAGFLWKINIPQEISWRHQGPVTSVAFSPDGLSILSASEDNTIILRDLGTRDILQTWRHESAVNSVAFSPNGKYVLTASRDGTAVLREIQNNKIIYIWRHKDSVCSLAFSPDSRYVITGSADKTAVLHDVVTWGQFAYLGL
jgi:WD40 repeat protein